MIIIYAGQDIKVESKERPGASLFEPLCTCPLSNSSVLNDSLVKKIACAGRRIAAQADNGYTI